MKNHDMLIHLLTDLATHPFVPLLHSLSTHRHFFIEPKLDHIIQIVRIFPITQKYCFFVHSNTDFTVESFKKSALNSALPYIGLWNCPHNIPQSLIFISEPRSTYLNGDSSETLILSLQGSQIPILSISEYSLAHFPQLLKSLFTTQA